MEFDVLKKQEAVPPDVSPNLEGELPDGSRRVSIKIEPKLEFENIKKPTDLNPDEVLGKVEEEIPQFPKREIYIPPRDLIIYADKLVGKMNKENDPVGKRAMKILKFDLENAGSNEEIEEYLKKIRDSGHLSHEDYSIMIGMIANKIESNPNLYVEAFKGVVDENVFDKININNAEGIYQNVLSKSLELLSDNDHKEFDLMLDSGKANPNTAMIFFKSKISNLDQIVIEESEKI